MKVQRRFGRAKRVRVSSPISGGQMAWDCRTFGLGRVIAPKLPVDIEIERGIHLDLRTGDLWAA